MDIRPHSLFGHAVLWAGCLLSATTCSPSSGLHSGRSPTAPATVQQARVSAQAQTFPLVSGSFTITNREGDGIVGTYTGTLLSPGAGAAQTASVMLQISSGSGVFAGVTGSFTLSGVGSFADTGSFRLHGQGEVVLADGKRATIVLNLRGSSVATCSPSQQIVISQTAIGAMGHAGRVTAILSHEVRNAGCSS